MLALALPFAGLTLVPSAGAASGQTGSAGATSGRERGGRRPKRAGRGRTARRAAFAHERHEPVPRPRAQAGADVTLIDALDARLPMWSYEPPAGGLFLWAQLPEPVSTSLSLEAAERDLQITPGPRFAAEGVLERHLRLPFTLAPGQLERAVAILADLVPGEGGRATASDLVRYVA
jgi:hypothetical protein